MKYWLIPSKNEYFRLDDYWKILGRVDPARQSVTDPRKFLFFTPKSPGRWGQLAPDFPFWRGNSQ